MLLNVLARAAGVIGAILDDPIGFLGNLISGVMAGLNQFVDNIGEHLKKGLMGWLFGALEGAGIQLPDTFDLKGILSIVLQVLGLTYANIRSRAVRMLGEETVSRLEQVAEVFKILVTEGPAGLWKMLVEKLGSIKYMLLEQIQNWVIEKVIKAGVIWVISLLNPASAFIKACKAIYDIVMFFIERGKQILDLVNAVLDTISAIVTGNIQAMANKVEGALARMIPVAISFLASLLGLGGISEKIREIIETIQKPVNEAIDWVIGKAVALVKAAGSFLGGKKSKDKVVEEPEDPVKQAKVDAALLDLDAAEKAAAASEKEVTHEEALAIAADVQKQHPVIQEIQVEHGEGVWQYFYRASAKKKHSGLQPAASGGTKPLVGTYGELTAKQSAGHEAHHVPQLQFADNLSTGLREAADESTDPAVKKTLKKAAGKFLDEFSAGGHDLSAISVHEGTHRVRGKSPARIHGSEIRPDLEARLRADTSINYEDVPKVQSGEVAVKPGETTYSAQITTVKARFADEATRDPAVAAAAGKHCYQIILAAYSAEEARALYAVEVALDQSTLDGTPAENKQSVQELRTHVKMTWRDGLLGEVLSL